MFYKYRKYRGKRETIMNVGTRNMPRKRTDENGIGQQLTQGLKFAILRCIMTMVTIKKEYRYAEYSH